MKIDIRNRLKRLAEKYWAFHAGNAAKVWMLRRKLLAAQKEVVRLEGEIKSLVEIIEPGSWK